MTASGDSSRRGVVQVLHFEDQFTLISHGDTLAISESKNLVIIKHSVQVLNPNGIDRTVTSEPNIEFRRPGVALLPKSRKHTRNPIVRDLTLHTVHLFISDSLRIHLDDTISQSSRHFRKNFSQSAQNSSFSCNRKTKQHETVTHLRCLIHLNDLKTELRSVDQLRSLFNNGGNSALNLSVVDLISSSLPWENILE